MSITDIAVDRQHQLLAQLRQATEPPPSMIAIGKHLSRLLNEAVPCYWNWHAVRQAVAAAKTYPNDAQVLRSDLLAPVQWWYLDNPALPKAATAPHAEVVEALLLVDGARLGPAHAHEFHFSLFCRVKHEEMTGPYPAPLPTWTALVPFNTPWLSHGYIESWLSDYPMDTEEIERATAIAIFVLSSVCWLHSTVARMERTSTSRAMRRRLALTHDHPSATTHVVTLRAAESEPHEAIHREVEWACRWSVRGHWRNQAMREGHRTMFIAPHIKGPAGKPFRAPGGIRYKIDR